MRAKSEIINSSFRDKKSIDSDCLFNRYCTEIDLNNFEDSENLQVVVRLESKNSNESILAWCLDGIILDYVGEK